VAISSRTPEGTPSHCSLCGAKTNIEFSSPAKDAPCPNCGYLLWESSQLVESITNRLVETTGNDGITVDMLVDGLGADSLDVVELVMELEEEYDFSLSDGAGEQLNSVGDVVRFILGVTDRGDH